VINAEQHEKDAVIPTGGYLTIWRLEKDGTWKVLFDTGCPGAVASVKK
jgi:hypothetical protein